MKILIFSIIVIIIISGCIKSKGILVTDNHYITNNTTKKIIYQFNTDFKSFSFYINQICKDSLLTTISEKRSFQRPWFYYYIYFHIYNLSDTISIRLPTDTTAYSDTSSLLYNIFYSKENNNSTNTHWISDIHLTINDTLLTLFKKDTSMLTKFKDYYNK